MVWIGGIHRFRDGLPDYIAQVAAGEEVIVCVPGHHLTVTPQDVLLPDCPVVSISAFRPRAGRWLRRAVSQPVVLTWYGRPTALIALASADREFMQEGVDDDDRPTSETDRHARTTGSLHSDRRAGPTGGAVRGAE